MKLPAGDLNRWLRSWVALQTFTEIVFWERGGLGRRAEGGRRYADGRGRASFHLLVIAGEAFDAVTGERGGDEFDQIFHRGS